MNCPNPQKIFVIWRPSLARYCLWFIEVRRGVTGVSLMTLTKQSQATNLGTNKSKPVACCFQWLPSVHVVHGESHFSVGFVEKFYTWVQYIPPICVSPLSGLVASPRGWVDFPINSANGFQFPNGIMAPVLGKSTFWEVVSNIATFPRTKQERTFLARCLPWKTTTGSLVVLELQQQNSQQKLSRNGETTWITGTFLH